MDVLKLGWERVKVDMEQSMSQLSTLSRAIQDMQQEMVAFRNAMQQGTFRFTDVVQKKL